MQAQSRKRPAPGTSPLPPQQQQMPPTYPSAVSDGIQYANDGSISIPDSNYDPELYGNNMNGMQPQSYTPVLGASNQLIRRNGNHSLATRGGAVGLGQEEQWQHGNSTGLQDHIPEDGKEDEQDLEFRAAAAKRDAQLKRKQIPPFVLKLWSFLNESRNTDLIRWTDGGTAFTVLDEDEFARTLIPELFKHNNYASFVRQLNMYGFHKKVGLNANSMKAAEKKIKDPNVYWHEYFREGREDLLWLIQKPQSKSAAAKRRRGDHKGDQGDSDDDQGGSPEAAEGQTIRKTGRGANSNLVTLPRTEVADLRQEIQRLQRQQSVISKMIAQLKEQNEQFYRQATEFQSLHDRHENSINAILTFLATFYSKSLEAGVDLAGMFGNINPQQGSVVDVGDGDFGFANNEEEQQVQRYKRPQLLLEGSSPMKAGLQQPQTNMRANSTRSSASPATSRQQTRNTSSATSQPPRASVSPAIKDDAETPNVLNQYPESEDMISLINAANANTPNGSGPNFDFPSALNHAQNASGNATLTPQQRNDMLNLIASQTNNQQGNNALTNPSPPMPNLEQFNRTQQQLEMLTRLQSEQDNKLQHLAGRVQPLSPVGGIPGYHEGANYGDADMGQPSSDFDIDAFINSADNYFTGYDANNNINNNVNQPDFGVGNTNFDDDPTGLNFDFGGAGAAEVATGTGDELFGQEGDEDDGGGRVIESLSSEATSPTAGHAHEEETPPKRRKLDG